MNQLLIILSLSTVAFSILLYEKTYAADNFFLPGDAFFPTRLTLESLDQLAKTKTIQYASPIGSEYGKSGDAGYAYAYLPDLDEEFVLNMKGYFKWHVSTGWKDFIEDPKSGKKVPLETDGASVLVYPSDFDPLKFWPGLRYNEHWRTETVKFGHDHNQINPCCSINHKDALMESWRDATKVPPLQVILPKTQPKPKQVIEEPIVIKGPYQILIIQQPMIELFLAEEDIISYAGFWSDITRDYHFSNNEWDFFEHEASYHRD
ncbi:Hypothetical protein PBC10988_27440 [Planctomycetales bacterium 10988]|nr:Hypothetical protein PBC10988_27440 [Planctomycetales bacterium 10988]